MPNIKIKNCVKRKRLIGQILSAQTLAYFHGEQHVECPHCKAVFEIYSADTVKCMKYVYLCPACRKPFDLD